MIMNSNLVARAKNQFQLISDVVGAEYSANKGFRRSFNTLAFTGFLLVGVVAIAEDYDESNISVSNTESQRCGTGTGDITGSKALPTPAVTETIDYTIVTTYEIPDSIKPYVPEAVESYTTKNHASGILVVSTCVAER